MKKTILLSAMLLLAALGARSQDTLDMSQPISNYYNPVWLDTTMEVYIAGHSRFRRDDTWEGYGMYTKDSLTVYGIAYSVINHERDQYGWAPYIWTDTTLDNVYEYVGLFVRDADSLRPYGSTLIMHAWDAPLYYMRYTGPLLSDMYEPYTIFPFYERYYDTPLQVADTFFICNSNRGDKEWDRNMGDHGEGPRYFLARNIIIAIGQRCPALSVATSLSDGHWMFNPHPNFIYMMFPILTPPDTTHNPVDTTHIDTTHIDTVGIAMRLLERYVGLQPNPAAERVQVTSSLGLQRIEVYNAAGVKVDERKASGYSATLDVSALPAGPYLVRIATPRGTVTKKLVVRRR